MAVLGVNLLSSSAENLKSWKPFVERMLKLEMVGRHCGLAFACWFRTRSFIFASLVFSLWSRNNTKLPNSGVSVRIQGDNRKKWRKRHATLSWNREMEAIITVAMSVLVASTEACISRALSVAWSRGPSIHCGYVGGWDGGVESGSCGWEIEKSNV